MWQLNLTTNNYKSYNNYTLQKNTLYRSVLLFNDPVPPSTNHYRTILTHYQPVPPFTNLVIPSTNSYRPILTHT